MLGKIAARPRPCTCQAVKAKAGSKRSSSSLVTIRFSIPYRCRFGQHLRVVGGCTALGDWDLKRALPMTWHDGDVWSAEAQLPVGRAMDVEYKYVVCEGDETSTRAAWKPGNNFVISLPGSGNGSVKVKDAWDEAHREVQIEMMRGGRGRSAASKGSKSEAEQAVAALSTVAASALQQLEGAVQMSLELLDSSADVASPELLAADRMVAAAAQRAAMMSKALDVAAVSTSPSSPSP